jgi:hypothetical protein
MTSRRNMKKMRKTQKSRKTIKKTKTQRLYKQKGCSKRGKRGGSCGCGSPFGGKGPAMKGGDGCAMCMKGGSTLSPYPPQPALIGAPWKGDIGNWPGVAGIDGVTNHYAMNKYVPYDPVAGVMQERAGSLFLGEYTGGGKKKAKRMGKMSKKRGGGLIPQDLVNFGRTFTYGLGSAYNSINGYQQPVNPLPYKDQLTNATKPTF